MARPQEKPTPNTRPYSPIPEGTEDEQDIDGLDNHQSCFQWFCLGSERGESHKLLSLGNDVSWVVSQLKKLKQTSELVAGPKWKNLIRKMSQIRSRPKNHEKTERFGYSPSSYALNFEEEEEDGILLHSFSSRFAPHLTHQ